MQIAISQTFKNESKGDVEIILALILKCLTDCYLHIIFPRILKVVKELKGVKKLRQQLLFSYIFY